ncbi:H(+)-transporting V1 sector ATPase subunit G KNAG_0B04820 [Huiozyma naganishii CBS 8797]|uniref:V-type proton ATPase subunit G n=1 Tax=Huiozyma naganishii (strain ATCC MYA-139 / BCRC 22969 / CBS 8797 / KCTC 17520 / NBRC 10181 / NCYC 3082 / Yp74L-3) TaxID=1071383 RepID=J7S509_HUIN7|nr:hypothetical protein KNAG_0B04820 [Kazachstania naganishii CBS 8797]CCK68916.1 hypothetical protein KNAG_0B04820 [Kazachstania naganishii CBS 8797]
MSQNGITTLLRAEKDAQDIISKARKYRQDKLKQAKLDAAAEISAYKATKDQELRDFEKNNQSDVKQLELDAERDIQTDLQEIEKTVAEKKGAVVDLLVKAATNPVGGVHINAQKSHASQKA